MTRIELGWDIWNPPIKQLYQYFDYTMYDERRPEDLPTTCTRPTWSADKTVDYIRQLATDDQPFFIWSSHVAPHNSCARRDDDVHCDTPTDARATGTATCSATSRRRR